MCVQYLSCVYEWVCILRHKKELKVLKFETAHEMMFNLNSNYFREAFLAVFAP